MASSRTLTLFLHPETRARIADAATKGRSAAAEVRLLAEVRQALLERCQPADILDGHLALLAEVIAANPIQRLRDVTVLPYLVDERIRSSDAAQRHGVDGERYAFRLRTMKFPELLALVFRAEQHHS